MSDFRRERHSVSKLVVHLVFVTKYRKKIFDAKVLDWLQLHFATVCLNMDCRMVAADGESDHFHILVEYPPSVSISDLAKQLKGTASRQLRLARPDIARRYYEEVLWTPSYFAVSAGGAPLSTIKKYVEEQRQ